MIDTNTSLVTFWYRRVSEITVLLSALIIAFWLLATLFADEPLISSLRVSDYTFYGALATFVISVASLAITAKKLRGSLALISIYLGTIMMTMAVATTGHLQSLYAPLWILIGLFSAIAGLTSLLPVLVVVIGYGVYLVYSSVTINWVAFGLTFLLPLILSYVIWTRRYQSQEKTTSAVSVLAKELNQESNKSDIIVSAIADGVIVVDGAGIIQLINPAAQTIIGWGNDDAVSLDYRSVLKIVGPKETIIEEARDPVQQCLHTNKAVVTDHLAIRTVSGKQLLASILVSPIGKANAGAIIVFRDITKQRAEEREQAEFISTASHEMRTPVAAIEGYLGLALNPQTASIDEKVRSYLVKAQEASQHLGRLFQGLLDISKLEDGRMNDAPSVINIATFIRAVIEDFEEQLKEKTLTLTFKPDKNTVAGQNVAPIFYANVDTDHLREVMENLISNAIKYTKEGSIVIDVAGNDERVWITVEDSGIGIPAEDIPHLFQKFYRVDNSDTREIGGTGLGLYLSRRFVESMEGTLTVKSEYGKGSVFTVDLPRVSKEAASSAIQAATKDQTENTGEV